MAPPPPAQPPTSPPTDPRAPTRLDPGESGLVEPRPLDDSGRLWSPGLKDGVAPGSFFHLTECCGPVLGLMRADTLADAVERAGEAARLVVFPSPHGFDSSDRSNINLFFKVATLKSGTVPPMPMPTSRFVPTARFSSR